VTVHFQIPSVPHPVVAAYRRDYETHPESVVYEAWTELSEHVALFVAPDGSALALINRDPMTYLKTSEPWKFDAAPMEEIHDPGTFDPSKRELLVKAAATFL
jgi:hypothetical protein